MCLNTRRSKSWSVTKTALAAEQQKMKNKNENDRIQKTKTRAKSFLASKVLLGLTGGIVLACSASWADTTTITFDTLAPGTFVGGQYAVDGVRFDRRDLQNNPGQGGFAVVQASVRALSAPNYLYLEPAEFASDYLRGVFGLTPHSFVSAYVGVVNYPFTGPVVVTLTAYDAANNPVGTATATLNTQVPAQWEHLSVTAPGAGNIARFTIDGGFGNGVVVDNVSFDSVPPPFPPYYPGPPNFQALLQQSGAPATNGGYGFQFSLFNQQTAGMPISGVITDYFPVANGLLNAPLSFSPDAFWGQPLFLDMSVQGPSDAVFTPIGPRLPIAPAPQAIYAYSAGSVLALDQGQAVSSLNGLTDAVQLQAGFGITLTTSSNNTIVISRSTTASASSGPTTPTASAAPSPDPVLARLATLKIQNEALEKRLNQIEQALQSIAGKN
jgi:hypothetical protein